MENNHEQLSAAALGILVLVLLFEEVIRGKQRLLALAVVATLAVNMLSLSFGLYSEAQGLVVIGLALAVAALILAMRVKGWIDNRGSNGLGQ